MLSGPEVFRIGVGSEIIAIVRRLPIIGPVLTVGAVVYAAAWLSLRYWKVTLPAISLLYLRARWGSWILAAAGVAVPAALAALAWLYWERRGLATGVSGAAPSLVETARLVGRRLRIARQWTRIADSCGLVGSRSGRPLRLFRLRTTTTGAVGMVRVSEGRTEEDVEKACPAMAAMLRARDVEATPTSPGMMRLSFSFGDTLIASFSLTQLPAAPAGRVNFGRFPDGTPVSLSVGTSVLVGGVTGSGKSSAVWAILGGLVASQTPTRLWVLDPAGGVEFDALRRQLPRQYHGDPSDDLGGGDGAPSRTPSSGPTPQNVTRSGPRLAVVAYEDRAGSAAAFIQRFHDEMMQRHALVRDSGARKFQPTEDMPLNVLLVDELIPLQPILKKGADSPLGIVLSQGRKAGFIVIGCTQAGHVDVLGRARDLFHQRLCFATTSRESTEVVLGTAAPAHRIGSGSPGVGYVYSEDDQKIRKFRAAYVNDAQIKSIARGEPVGEPQALYRWYDRDDTLLYVGRSNQPVRRAGEHAQDKQWWRDVARSTVEWHPSLPAVIAAEKHAIETEQPIHNDLHNRKNPRRRAHGGSVEVSV
jgi:hypothetical protein